MARIVVIDDERLVRATVVDTLEAEGFDAVGAATGAEGLRAVRERRPDLVLLDLQMPGMSGIEVCKRLRADPVTSRVPIVMLTGLASEAHELLGFDVGADDYVTKPWRASALLARIRAVLRRARPGVGARKLRAGPLELDPETSAARVAGVPLHLTPTEFHVLFTLASRPGLPMTREEILEPQGERRDSGPHSVSVHVASIRRKLGAHANLVATLHGIGYRFDPDAKPDAAPPERAPHPA